MDPRRHGRIITKFEFPVGRMKLGDIHGRARSSSDSTLNSVPPTPPPKEKRKGEIIGTGVGSVEDAPAAAAAAASGSRNEAAKLAKTKSKKGSKKMEVNGMMNSLGKGVIDTQIIDGTIQNEKAARTRTRGAPSFGGEKSSEPGSMRSYQPINKKPEGKVSARDRDRDRAPVKNSTAVSRGRGMVSHNTNVRNVGPEKTGPVTTQPPGARTGGNSGASEFIPSRIVRAQRSGCEKILLYFWKVVI